jgi:hypothetical protein
MDKINLDKANKLRTCGKVKAVKTHAANVECNHYNKGEVWACNISLHDYDRQIKVDDYIAKAHYFQDLMVKEGKQSYISQGTILFEDDNIEAAVKSLQKLKILAQKHTEKCQQYEVINYFGYNPLTKLTIWSVELFVIADKTIAAEVFNNFKMVNYRNYVWDGTVVMPSCIQRIMPRASDFPDDLSMERWLVMTNNSHFQSGHGFKAPSKAAKAEAPAMWVDENGKSHPVCPECGEPLTKTVLLTNAEYTLLETGRIGIKAFRFSTSKDDIMPRLGYQEIKETQKEGIPYYARDPVAV